MYENIVIKFTLKEIGEIVQKKICEENGYGVHRKLRPTFNESNGELEFVADFYREKKHDEEKMKL
ncbi:hypothetical protein GRF59_14745 [Paenibacillus sp. HJL G12]|uniref:Uncharacterized protein n=1 Tax=Paenibacillus dendrobii TaxID=2691084 RepID=A0A7X3IJ21_9BACL|nr:hypothetical protein [Paenibacillus dendrobii]MWV44877.1 hypothetical protein [Paenibacillus dendrobii]